MATADVSDSVPATGTLNHHKTITLAQLLGIKRCFALGVLEALWDATTTLAPQGDIGRVSNRAMAIEENLQILCRPCNGRKKDIWLFVQ